MFPLLLHAGSINVGLKREIFPFCIFCIANGIDMDAGETHCSEIKRRLGSKEMIKWSEGRPNVGNMGLEGGNLGLEGGLGGLEGGNGEERGVWVWVELAGSG